MDYSILSKHRTKLMGIAIVLVGIFHSSIVHINDGVDFVCFIGDMGVDIFFLVSGFGMYYTYLKNPSWKEFYWKRMFRIAPAWVLVNVLVQVYTYWGKEVNWFSVIKCLTGFSFWLDGSLYFWYIPAALMFYLLTPCFMCGYRDNKKKAYLMVGIGWMVILLSCLLCHNSKYFVFLFRFPVFFIGIFMGELSHCKVPIQKKHMWLMGVCLGIGLAGEYMIKHSLVYSFIHYEYKYILYCVIAIPFYILISCFFECVKAKFSVLQFLGGITLEIYLLHEFILKVVTSFLRKVPFDNLGIIYNLLVFMMTVLLAKLLHQLLDKVVGVYNKKIQIAQKERMK